MLLSGGTNSFTRSHTIKTADIRSLFLDYFRRHDHRVVPSSPVIPWNDPTILFTNAGMNQFKDVFTGKRRAEHPRAASAQKCIRAGGKHNDLDNVGYTARHHTFFEMLGNFSFGDYFKEEAISYAWEWITRELRLPVDRLYATVYESDDEAFALWGKVAPPLKNGRVLRFGKKDNYWSMGSIGPCGPCSEIHFDRGVKFGTGPQDIINGETERFVEIWNLVFMQFDQAEDGSTTPLPKPSVDTGAGLERITAIIQNADTNYGIDIFRAIIAAIEDVTGAAYKGDHATSHHVIADHLRALSFAIADGAGISNEGQGYVLRRILRRAARHGHLLGMEEPFIYRLVPTLVSTMGDAYSELREKQRHIENVLKAEEESFGRTLSTGMDLFDRIASETLARGQKMVAGDEVFKLYDTYGFPIDLTEIMATEKGLTVDRVGFEKAMERQKEQSRAGNSFDSRADAGLQALLTQLDKSSLPQHPPTVFERHSGLALTARIITAVGVQDTIALVLDRTPFYAEAGGQMGDVGSIRGDGYGVEVSKVFDHQGHLVHLGKLVSGTVQRMVSSPNVTAQVDAERRWDIMRNHTATHLTHAALRQVLGDHVKQSGSYVGPDRLRFDFSHHQPMTADEIRRVEELVNGQILKGIDLRTDEMDAESAKKSGAMALFGEKYGERVRVVTVEGFSKELCGGTHVDNTSQIGPFFVTLETGIAAGVRRIEAITGRAAIEHMLRLKQFSHDVAAAVNRPEEEALGAVRDNREQVSALTKELKRVKAEMFAGGNKTVGEEVKIGEVTVAFNDFGETDRDTMAGWADSRKASEQAFVAVAIGTVNGKPAVMIACSARAVREHNMHAGDLAKEVLQAFGGRGGGKADFAQGGMAEGTAPRALFEATAAVIRKVSR